MDFSISWEDSWFHLVQLLIAWVLTLPVAWDRELESRSAGLRTFPLVAMAACGYTLVGVSALETAEAGARVVQGLVTGIGFIGGGAILKSKGSVMGTATAAGIWNTGLIGMAVAFSRYEIAVVISLISFVTLRYVAHLKTDDTPNDEEAPSTG